eukprot:TRINITY_DN16974_c0_g1_i1.p1 TRINITY_DN16974_c0_g1~~TRINITY_DN16974_c0_g1_i1.p1  ORF type:complete len:1844 (-),score=205.81 TRINITY_DN16974_c0_g1_i1:175-5706(-)
MALLQQGSRAEFHGAACYRSKKRPGCHSSLAYLQWLVLALYAQSGLALPIDMLPSREGGDCSCGSADCELLGLLMRHARPEEAAQGEVCKLIMQDVGCDCSRCAALSCTCQPPSNHTPEPACVEAGGDHAARIEGGGTCTPRCPPGRRPSVEKLICQLGAPMPDFSCLENVVPAAPSFAKFVDFDAQYGFVAGLLQVEMEASAATSIACKLLVHWKLRTSSIQPEPFAEMNCSGENKQGFWLPRIMIPVDAEEAVIFQQNVIGRSVHSRAVRLLDVGLEPSLPEAERLFRVTLRGVEDGRLAIDVDDMCAGSFLIPPVEGSETQTSVSISADFSVFAVGRMALCHCIAGGSCSQVGRIAIAGKVTQTILSVRPEGPLPGDRFHLHVLGSLLRVSERLFAISSTAQGCDGGSISDITFAPGMPWDDDVLEDATMPYEELIFSGFARTPGSFQICRWIDTCDLRSLGVAATLDASARCRRTLKASAQVVASLRVAPCHESCSLCMGEPGNCTICKDGSVPDLWGAANADRPVCSIETSSASSSLTPSHRDVVVEKIVQQNKGEPESETHAADLLLQPAACSALLCRGGEDALLKYRLCTGVRCDVLDRYGCCSDSPPSCLKTGLKGSVSKFQAKFLDDPACVAASSKDSSNARSKRVLRPMSVAMVGVSQLLIADEGDGHVLTEFLSWSFDMGGILKLNMANGSMELACPNCAIVWEDAPNLVVTNHALATRKTCNEKDKDTIHYPSSIRTAGSGNFWLIAESKNQRLKRIDVRRTGRRDDWGAYRVRVAAGDGAEDGASGSTPLACGFESSILRKASVHGTSAGDNGLAKESRLFSPTDVAIHLEEELILIAEPSSRRAEDSFSAARIRLVDQYGLIHTVATLTDGMCGEEKITVEWLPPHPDHEAAFLVACGRLWLFRPQQGADDVETWHTWHHEELILPSFTSSSSSADLSRRFNVISIVRVTPDGRLLLGLRDSDLYIVVAASLPAGGTYLTDVTHLIGTIANRQFGNSKSEWADTAKLEHLTSILAGADGSVYVAIMPSSGSEILRLRRACGPGYGYDSASGRCEICQHGTYNDGSRAVRDRCQPCQDPITESSPMGATRCQCAGGHYRKNSSGIGKTTWVENNCRPVLSGYYSPPLSEKLHKCREGQTTFNETQVREVANEVSSAEPSETPYFQARWEDLVMPAPGAFYGKSESACTCCYGWYPKPGSVEEGCVACPPGAFCAGAAAFPAARIRQENGWWIPAHEEGGELPTVRRCQNTALCYWTPYALRWRAFSTQACQDARYLEECRTDHCVGLQVGGSPGRCPGSRTGHGCGRCGAGTFAAISTGECSACGSSSSLLRPMMLAVVLPTIAMASIEKWAPGARMHAVYNILSMFGVVLMFFEHVRSVRVLTGVMVPTYFGVDLTETIEWFMWYLFPVELDCVAGDSFFTRRLFMTAAPCVVPLVMLVVAGAFYMAHRLRLKLMVQGWRRAADWLPEPLSSLQLISMLGALMGSTIVTLTSVAMSYFQCYDALEMESASPSATMYLHWSPDVACSSSGEWLTAMPLGLLGLSLPLGWLSMQLLGHRLSAATLPWWHLHASMRFVRTHLHWDLYIIARAFVLQLCLLMPLVGLKVKLFLVLVVTIAVLIWTFKKRPYTENVVSIFDGLLTLATAIFLLFTMQLTPLPGIHLGSLSLIVTATSAFAVAYAGLVIATACRDLVYPKKSADAEAASLKLFVQSVQDLVNLAARTRTKDVYEVCWYLDSVYIFRMQKSMHLLEQMAQPSQRSTKTKYSRLNDYAWRGGPIDMELQTLADELECNVVSQALGAVSCQGVANHLKASGYKDHNINWTGYGITEWK